jgi:nucleotide-binding universal stress UspA family protein
MKTLLVPFYDDDAAQAAVDTALTIAGASGGYVEGLFVMRPPQIIDGEGIALAGSYLNQLKEEGRRLGDRAADRFRRTMSAKGIPEADVTADASGANAGWREMDGLEGQVLGDYGRLFDLIVIGRDFGQPWLDWTVMCESALFETGRPVLVASATFPAKLGERVMIAWNHSTETARTIALSMPLLSGAAAVEVLSIDGWAVPGPTGEQVAAHLRRNGISAAARTAEAGGRAPGEAILREAGDFGADLLVKGAYTQSRLRQLVFGGATRQILAGAEIPVILAH